MERSIDKRKLARYEATEVALAEEQNTQMCNVVDAIDQVATNDLQGIFEEGEAHGVGEKLREIWTTDKREQKEQFKKEMMSSYMTGACGHFSVTGKRSNQWSMVTIRMGKTCCSAVTH